MTGQLVSLNIGLPAPLEHAGSSVQSGIRKLSVNHSLHLSTTGFAGDGQADLVHHGGPNKAVYAYPIEHYGIWQARLGHGLSAGALGENLTLSGLLETDVCIGDCFRLGSALVQVSQPRQPCFKLGALHRKPVMVAWMIENGLTGFYFRVLEVGQVSPGTTVKRTARGAQAVTVFEANRVMHHDKHNAEGIKRVLAETALSDSWVETLSRRLEALEQRTPDQRAAR